MAFNDSKRKNIYSKELKETPKDILFDKGLRVCPKCNELKSLIEFGKDRSNKNGLQSRCKICDNARKRAWKKATPHRDAQRQADARRWRREHPDYWAQGPGKEAAEKRERKNRLLAAGKKQCSKCLQIKTLDMFGPHRQAFAGLYSQCRECVCEGQRSRQDKNTIKQRKWRNNNREHIRNYINEYHKKRRKEDPCFKMDQYFRSQFRTALDDDKAEHTKEIVERTLGYTIKEFVVHIENQFEEGMNWNNHSLTGWHIDHKMPVSLLPYDSTDHPNFKKCWALENLQPLWAQDNLSKGNKIL